MYNNFKIKIVSLKLCCHPAAIYVSVTDLVQSNTKRGKWLSHLLIQQNKWREHFYRIKIVAGSTKASKQ